MFLHRVVLVIPMAKGDRYILSRRAKDKHPFPDSWCCGVGGKVHSGEALEEAAIREMREEMGVEHPVREVVSFMYDKQDYKAIFTVFTTKDVLNPGDLKLDPREIQYSEAVSLGEILESVEKNPKIFSPTFIAAIREFARMRKRERPNHFSLPLWWKRAKYEIRAATNPMLIVKDITLLWNPESRNSNPDT